MASLLIVRRGGEIVGICDASCYNAKGKACVCPVCEGANHGKGIEEAVANTRRMVAEWRARHDAGESLTVELDDTVQQHTLF